MSDTFLFTSESVNEGHPGTFQAKREKNESTAKTVVVVNGSGYAPYVEPQ